MELPGFFFCLFFVFKLLLAPDLVMNSTLMSASSVISEGSRVPRVWLVPFSKRLDWTQEIPAHNSFSHLDHLCLKRAWNPAEQKTVSSSVAQCFQLKPGNQGQDSGYRTGFDQHILYYTGHSALSVWSSLCTFPLIVPVIATLLVSLTCFLGCVSL